MNTAHAPILKLQSGTVRGRTIGSVNAFRGVPYAKPPVGALRFAKPEPAAPWEGIRDAIDPGPSAPQRAVRFDALDLAPVVGAGWTRGDDYLTLNIWMPAEPAQNDKRPIMVWVHGGGFSIGSKDAAVHDGASFARSGVIAIAINYRLGVEGFAPVDGAPTNLGLRDMLEALAWVQRNAGHLGGDAQNVTVFGESAGAMSIGCLITSPLAKGLFRRAIMQSGSGSVVRTIEQGRRLATAAAKRLRISGDRESFIGVDAERLARAGGSLARPGAVDLKNEHGVNNLYGLAVFSPVFGDDVVPVEPLAALTAEAAKEIDLLVVTTADEANFWFAPTALRFIPKWLARLWLRKTHPRGEEIFRAYQQVCGDVSAGRVLAAALSDLTFRWPSRLFAAAHQGRTHVMSFDWKSPAAGGRLGAAHSVEMPFVFDTLAVTTGPKGFVGMNPPQELATRMHGIWVGFATSGALPWDEFDAKGRVVYSAVNGEAAFEAEMPARAFGDGRSAS